MINTNVIYNEDCLIGMEKLGDKSVDLILTDLPYGVTAAKWGMWKDLFAKFNCELKTINEDDITTSENEEKEIFSDIISLLHCFAMRMYSSRRKKKITLVKEDLENEIGL